MRTNGYVAALAAIIALGAGCTGDPADTASPPFVPTFAWEEGGTFATGQISGDVSTRDGCITIENQGTSYLLLWPDGYAWDEGDGGVVDMDGDVAAAAGVVAVLGGGQRTLDEAEAAVGVIPARCQVGDYWLVAPATS